MGDEYVVITPETIWGTFTSEEAAVKWAEAYYGKPPFASGFSYEVKYVEIPETVGVSNV